jgi:repressor LexA
MTLTKRQRRILDFIRDYRERRGYAPTLLEIGRHFGLRSPATVHKHLRNLEAKGALRRRYNSSRGIEVLPEEGMSRATDLPLAGVLDPERPLLLTPAEQAVPVPSGLVGQRNTFVLQVKGGGLHDLLIGDGDLLVIEEAEQADTGALVLCLAPGNRPRLLPMPPPPPPQGPGRPPARLEPGLRLRGRVTGVLRKYGGGR